jgi:hypothetical protein
MNKKILASVVSIVLIAAGCSQSSPPSQSAGTEDTHALYLADVAAFANIDSKSVTDFDNTHNHLFSEMFGGTDAASVEHYYNDRIHYAFSQDDLENSSLTPTDIFKYQGWENDPQAQTPDPSKGIVLGALNIGTGLWLLATLANEQATLLVEDQTIPITSTRTGIMMFGPGYAQTATRSDGSIINFPVVYRQSILIHEARHSDCTGGLSQSEIAIMRSAQTEEDFLKQIPLPHCGHTHIVCPSGTYQGVPACDAERYGAYKVGAEFTEAMIPSETDETARKMLQAMAIDTESRFIDTGSKAPDELAPNMTSAGVISTDVTP